MSRSFEPGPEAAWTFSQPCPVFRRLISFLKPRPLTTSPPKPGPKVTYRGYWARKICISRQLDFVSASSAMLLFKICILSVTGTVQISLTSIPALPNRWRWGHPAPSSSSSIVHDRIWVWPSQRSSQLGIVRHYVGIIEDTRRPAPTGTFNPPTRDEK